MPDHAPALHHRAEYQTEGLGAAQIGDVERRLSLYEQISNINAVRKLTILVSLVVIWELYTQIGDVSEYILPTFSSTGE